MTRDGILPCHCAPVTAALIDHPWTERERAPRVYHFPVFLHQEEIIPTLFSEAISEGRCKIQGAIPDSDYEQNNAFDT
jgi:hypothetical protein